MPNVRKPSGPRSVRLLQRRHLAGSRCARKQIFGAAMASLAGATLIWRRPFLDGLWASNARAYHRLAPFGSAAGAGFLVLGAALVIAGRGWFLRRFWGWGLAAALCGDPDRGKRGERHPGPFLGGGNRVDSCGRDTLFSFASASANCFPQEGFSRARNSLSLYLYLIHLSRESSGISPRVWGYFAR